MTKSGVTVKALASLIFAFALCATTQAQTRTFVSGTGSDTNACTRLSPCRSFQKAHDVVVAGGEVVALDSAGYGPITITKSVSIIGDGNYAGINTSSGTGVDISIATSETVVLRGLTLESTGAIFGIQLTAGGNLHVENCVIAGFSIVGIYVNSTVGTSARLFVRDTICRRNSNGIHVDAGTASLDHVRLEQSPNSGLTVLNSAQVSMTNSVASGNGSSGVFANISAQLNIEGCVMANNGGRGIESFGSATVRVSNSTVTNNTLFGFNNNGGTFESRGNNTVAGNNGGGAQTSGTITPITGQ